MGDRLGVVREPGLTGAFRQLFAILSRRRRLQFLLVLLLMLVAAGAEIVAIGSVVPFLTVLGGASGDAPAIWLFGPLAALPADQRVLGTALIFMVAVLGAAALRLALAWMSQRFILGVGHDLAVDIQRRILAQPYAFHVAQNSSAILASLEKVQVLISSVLLQVMHALTAAVIGLVIVVLLVQVDPFAAPAAAVGLILLYVILSWATRRRLVRNSAVTSRAYDERLKIVQESLGGIRDVIIDGSHERFLAAFRTVDRHFADARASTAFIAAAPRFVIEAAGMILIAGLAIMLAGRGGGIAEALPALGLLGLGALRLLPLLQQLYHSWSSLAGNRAVIADIMRLLRLPLPDPAAIGGAPLPFRESIRFEAVSFAYPGRRAPAIDGLTLTIPIGARVALVGRTGSGKSTLADLLMGLLEPDSGSIRIDGATLADDNRRAWRRNIAHVPQAIFLADDSIARNIAFSDPAAAIDMERVAAAARLAQLDEVIAALPDGYDTPVGERGIRLSGGQRQRLGLARAIYKDTPVLVLDEATNALDRDTEAAVLRTLDTLGREGRTIIIIAHRESAIHGCDMVVRLEDGRLA